MDLLKAVVEEARVILSFIEFLVVFQATIICLPYLFSIFCVYYPIISYFTPDYETALIGRYKRPVIGLRLCMRCKAIKYSRSSIRIQHYDDFHSLEASADRGCWLCQAIQKQLLESIEHRDKPPALESLEDLPIPRLLMWFAERTETRSGFLNNLRGKSMGSYDESVCNC